MSLKDKASLIFKPSRYKAGTAYSFRGLDWVFSRAGSGTRVNASGLIETVAASVPRVCYDGSDLTKDPFLLLEDSRTNFIQNSNNFSTGWTQYLATAISNATISLDGTANAWKLVNGGGTNYHFINFPYSGTTRVISLFVKAAEYDAVGISSRSTNSFSVFFDLTRKISSTRFDSSGSVVGGHGIEEHKDGWFRVWVYVTSMVQFNIHPVPSNYAGTLQGSDMPGDGSSGIFIWEAQIEDGSNLTSIIRTSGSTETRVSESLSIDNMQASTNPSVRGTFYVDMSAVDEPHTSGDAITIRNSNSAYGRAYYYERQFGFADTWGSSNEPNSVDGVRFKHIWRLDDNANGSFFQGGKKYTSQSTSSEQWNNVYQFYFSPAYATMKIYEIYISASALSDEDCIALTSFDDYEELVDVKGLTWESPTATNNRLTALSEL